VKASAAARLRALVDPAIGALEALVTQRKAPAVRLGAARDVLDRAGFGAPRKVDVTGGLKVEQQTKWDLSRLTEGELRAIRALLLIEATGAELTGAQREQMAALRSKCWIQIGGSGGTEYSMPDNGRDTPMLDGAE
jgi:hypothetical protein